MTMAATTIFVIDDQESVRYALDEMLDVFGFSVETYASADSFPALNISRITPISASWRANVWSATSRVLTGQSGRPPPGNQPVATGGSDLPDCQERRQGRYPQQWWR